MTDDVATVWMFELPIPTSELSVAGIILFLKFTIFVEN